MHYVRTRQRIFASRVRPARFAVRVEQPASAVSRDVARHGVCKKREGPAGREGWGALRTEEKALTLLAEFSRSTTATLSYIPRAQCTKTWLLDSTDEAS